MSTDTHADAVGLTVDRETVFRAAGILGLIVPEEMTALHIERSGDAFRLTMDVDRSTPLSPYTEAHVERLARLLAAGAGLTKYYRNFAPSARAYLNAAFDWEGETG